MVELYDEFFAMLRFTKNLCDCGMAEKVKDWFGFCQCREYEARKGISEKENPYRNDMEQILHDGFTFNSYSYGYDWRLSQEDRGRKCLLLFTGCEFYSHDEVPEGLLEIKDSFVSMAVRLEMELSKETKIIPLSLVTETRQKEAA